MRIKRLTNTAIAPTYATDGSAGMDLVVPRGIDDGNREQGNLPDVQDDIQRPQNLFGRDGHHIVP